MRQSIDRKGYEAFKIASMSDSTKVVSVDVFDTLLLRKTKPEPARFFDIGRKQLEVLRRHGVSASITEKDMLIKRLISAKAAYRNARVVDGVREPDYSYIARIMLSSLGVNPSDVLIEHMLDLELKYESSSLVANRLLVKILKDAQKEGKRVICVSDMYLSAKNIEALIYGCGINFIDTVYASSDFGYGKASKLLFEKVLELEAVDPEAFVHCGDNAFSDYHKATELGINAFHVPRGRNWRFADKTRRQLFTWRHGLNSL